MSDESSRWRNALLTLQGEMFFDLMKNYLGGVTTPYNKHELISRLEAFLQKDEVVETLLSLLEREDVAILTALSMLGDTQETRLSRFLDGIVEPDALYLKLLNLEERLWIFRDVSSGSRVIALCPVLWETVQKRVFEPGMILRKGDGLQVSSPAGAARPVYAACVLSLANKFRKKIRDSSKVHKSVKEAFESIFGTGVNVGAMLSPFVALAMNISADDGAETDWELLESLGVLGFEERAWTFAESFKEMTSGFNAINPLREVIGFWPDGVSFEEASAVRFLSLAQWPEYIQRSPEAMLDSCIQAGLLFRTGTVVGKPRYPEESLGISSVVSDDFSITMLPGVSWADAVFIARISVPVSFGDAAKLAIDRALVHEAFSTGLDAASIEARLVSMSGRQVPGPVSFALKSWESEQKSVTLVSSPVLVVEGKKRWMVENSPVFKGKIASSPAEGIYILAVSSHREARELLEAAGITHFGEFGGGPRRLKRPSRSGTEGEGRVFSSRARFTASDFDAHGGRSWAARNEMTGRLLAALERAELSDGARKTVSERITSGLVLSEAQFREDSARFERREAKGMDFLGKLRLLEQIKTRSQDTAEILYRNPQGDPERRFVKPETITRRGDSVRMEGRDRVTGEAVSLPVERLSLVRKIRGSMFG